MIRHLLCERGTAASPWFFQDTFQMNLLKCLPTTIQVQGWHFIGGIVCFPVHYFFPFDRETEAERVDKKKPSTLRRWFSVVLFCRIPRSFSFCPIKVSMKLYMFSRLTPGEQSLRQDSCTSSTAWYSSAWGPVNLRMQDKRQSPHLSRMESHSLKGSTKISGPFSCGHTH